MATIDGWLEGLLHGPTALWVILLVSLALGSDFDSFSRVAYARELYGDPEGAIEAMEFALQAGSGTPDNVAWAHVQLGNLWFTSGKLVEAQKAYGLSNRTAGAYAPALAGQAKIAAARKSKPTRTCNRPLT